MAHLFMIQIKVLNIKEWTQFEIDKYLIKKSRLIALFA